MQQPMSLWLVLEQIAEITAHTHRHRAPTSITTPSPSRNRGVERVLPRMELNAVRLLTEIESAMAA